VPSFDFAQDEERGPSTMGKSRKRESEQSKEKKKS